MTRTAMGCSLIVSAWLVAAGCATETEDGSSTASDDTTSGQGESGMTGTDTSGGGTDTATETDTGSDAAEGGDAEPLCDIGSCVSDPECPEIPPEDNTPCAIAGSCVYCPLDSNPFAVACVFMDHWEYGSVEGCN